MGMRQELDFRMQPEMNLEMVTLNEISRVIKDASPLQQVSVKIADIEDYLNSVNSSLVEPVGRDAEILKKRYHTQYDQGFSHLRAHYITALGFYAFAAPIMGIEYNRQLSKTFESWAQRRWNVEEPLSVPFVKADGEQQDARALVKVEEGVVPENIFRAGGHVHRAIKEIIQDAWGKLGKAGYSYSRHFRFVGAYDVCNPLFGAGVHSEAFEQLNRQLSEEHGDWKLCVPFFG
jgi:hypothetical protein